MNQTTHGVITKILILALVLTIGPAGNVFALNPTAAYELGRDAMAAGDYNKAAEYFNEAADQNPTAANFKAVGNALSSARRFEEAAQAFFKAGEIYANKGLKDDAEIYRKKAEGLVSHLEIYLKSDKLPNGAGTSEKYEPRYGAYIGAYLDQDPRLQGDGGYVQTNFKKFNEMMGKEHAIFFTYVHYGKQDFPSNWVDKVVEAGAVPELALEPASLAEVKDNSYLREFARDAAKTGVPVFLRFASEANGFWAPYFGDPAKYIEKFRLVSKVMAEEAPNVAMVWTVAAIPEKTIAEYYPGDAYVDWVGVNIYSVAYHNGDINQPALDEDPTSFVDYVYNTYAERKPIQISEYGATHQSIVAPNIDLTSFAVEKIRQLYSALPRRYPRVKSICWFDSNNINSPNVPLERRNDNYSLTDNNQVKKAYAAAVNEEYYLTSAVNPASVSRGYTSMPDEIKLDNPIELSAFARTYDPNYSILYLLDGQVLAEKKVPPYTIALNPNNISSGVHQLEIQVKDSLGTTAKRVIKKILVGDVGNTPAPKQTEMILHLGSNLTRINGSETTMDVVPTTIKGNTMVPFRFLANALGAELGWDNPSQTVSFQLDGISVSLTINQPAATVNGVKVKLDIPAQLINDRTMVPLRFVSESLGAAVDWEGSTQKITITY